MGLGPYATGALFFGTGALVVSAGSLVFEGHDVPTCLGVVPLQASVVPPYVQTQNLAVALQGIFR